MVLEPIGAVGLNVVTRDAELLSTMMLAASPCEDADPLSKPTPGASAMTAHGTSTVGGTPATGSATGTMGLHALHDERHDHLHRLRI